MDEILTGNNVYYPLAVGNKWNYQMKDGNTYYKSVTAVSPANPSEFTMFNSLTNVNSIIRKERVNYLTSSYDVSKMVVFMKDNLEKGDTFEMANTIGSILVVKVVDKGITKEVLGKAYTEVLLIEAERKMKNENIMGLNYFTRYYYALGIGLIETLTSMGDLHQLAALELKP